VARLRTLAIIIGMAADDGWNDRTWAALGVAAGLVMSAWVLMFTWVPPLG
jgi:hypothetical protein